MTATMTDLIRGFTADRLTKELAFAEAFAFEDDAGRAWLAALRAEAATRQGE